MATMLAFLVGPWSMGIFVALGAGALLVGLRIRRSRLESYQQTLQVARDQLVRTEQRATAGLVATAVAHDINNVLSILLVAQDEQLDPALQREALVRAGELLRRLRDAGTTGVQSDSLDVSAHLSASMALISRHPKLVQCDVKVCISPGIRGHTSAAALDQIAWNLVVNAGEATDGHGKVRVTGCPVRNELLLEVEDDGPGLPAGADVFALHATTKTHGWGVGLYAVKEAVAICGGTLRTGISALGGAHFLIRIPLG